MVGARDNVTIPGGALIDNAYDFTRDKRVSSADLVSARDNVTSPIDMLKLIVLP